MAGKQGREASLVSMPLRLIGPLSTSGHKTSFGKTVERGSVICSSDSNEEQPGAPEFDCIGIGNPCLVLKDT